MQHDDDGPDGPRRQRSVMATDSEWARITERAEAAGMSISAFICHRAGGSDRMPAGTMAEESFARLERIEIAVLTLAEIERGRLAERDEDEGWEAALRRVKLRLRAGRTLSGGQA